MLVPPSFLGVLAMFCVAFAMAGLPILRRPKDQRGQPFGHLVPHPSHPSSMLSFVALPCFLMLLGLARLKLSVWTPVDPVNGPDSHTRWEHVPPGVHIDVVDDGRNGAYHFSYRGDISELTVDAARRAESAWTGERVQAVRELAWWTGVCPNYAPFALPRLVRALRDPDPRVKGAAAIGLGSTGADGAPAVPDLLGARGTSVDYLDHLLEEAVFLIEHSAGWAPATECEDVPTDELERRMAHRAEGEA